MVLEVVFDDATAAGNRAPDDTAIEWRVDLTLQQTGTHGRDDPATVPLENEHATAFRLEQPRNDLHEEPKQRFVVVDRPRAIDVVQTHPQRLETPLEPQGVSVVRCSRSRHRAKSLGTPREVNKVSDSNYAFTSVSARLLQKAHSNLSASAGEVRAMRTAG